MLKRLLTLTACFFFVAFAAMAQETVAGKVTDESGNAMPGVNVILKGTTVGTVTDADGGFSMSIPGDSYENGVLVFSFIGYQKQEEAINGRTSINLSLQPDVTSLEEVVVVGYGTMRREDISGAVSTIQTKDLPIVTNTSINQLLEGRAAGLNLSQVSAQPGGRLNINIRGAISPQGNNAPLYVIDGVPLFNNSSPEQGLESGQLGFGGGVDRDPLSSLNPADIESVDILKDASATAIYGASAANGVILITTKHGKNGPLQVNYRGSYTVQSPKTYIQLFGPKEFMQQHNRLSHDRYLYLNSLAPYGTADPNSVAPFNPDFTTFDIQSIEGQGTDWLDLLIRNGYIDEQSASLSGGNENTHIFSSFDFFDNQAILENSNLRRYTGRINFDQKIGSRVKLNVNLSASQMNNKNVSTGLNSGGVEKYNMLQTAFAFSPTLPIYDAQGNYTRSFDPLITNPAAFLSINDNSTTGRITVAPNLEVKVLDHLKLNLVGGIDRQNSQRDFYLPSKANDVQYPDGSAQKSSSNIGNYSTEAYFTYDKQSENLAFSIVGGGGLYKSTSNGFGLVAVNFFTDAFQGNNVGAATAKDLSSFSSNRTERNRQSLFYRANLSLKDRYILTLTGRYDGDSEFAANKKFGFFPGASVAWRLSNEDFLSGVDFLSDLKLRFGVGEAGNPINAGSAVALLGLNPNATQNQYLYEIGGVVYSGVTQLQLANPNLTWETDQTMNLGLDFGLFANRVSGSVEVYQRTAKNLLDFDRLPLNNAITQLHANIGSTRSEGVEVTVRSVNTTGALKWTSMLTASNYKSLWVERNLSTVLPKWIKDSDPYTAIYGWKTDGIIQSNSEKPSYMPNANPGNVRYVDSNNDGVLTSDDVVLLGQSAPKWNLGLGNTFTYKGFDLNFFIYAKMGNLASINQIGRGFNTASPGDRLAISNMQNVPVDIRRVWTADNATGDWPGLAVNPYSGSNPATNNGFDNNDFFLEKANFARFKNVMLGYTLPERMLGKLSLRSIRVFVDVENLAVLTNFDGLDPEYSETNPYPQAVSTTFGIDVGL